MIDFNYKILRDEGDEKRVYTATIPTKLDDLICIEGPNSSGKSTLLHIIALGLYGMKNSNIKDSLQKKLRDLSGSEHQEVTFSFSISNEFNKLQIISEKKNGGSTELSVYEIINGKRVPLTPETFEKKYNLIYDIPDDPVQRLDELTQELRERQKSLGHKVEALVAFLRETIRQVQDARDEGRLKDLQRSNENLSRQINNASEEMVNHEADLVCLKRYYNTKFYVEYRKETERLRSKIELLDTELKGREKRERATRRRSKALTREAKNLIEAIRKDIKDAVWPLKALNIRTKEDYLSVWQDLDLEKTLLHQDRHKHIFDATKSFKLKLTELGRTMREGGKLEEATLLSQLIDLLTHYDPATVLPGMDKNIKQFIAVLEKRYQECKDYKTQYDKYAELIRRLETIEENCRQFIDLYLPELIAYIHDQTHQSDEEVDEIQEQRDMLDSELNRYQHKVEHYRDEAIRCGVKESEADAVLADFMADENLRFFATYDEKQFEDKTSDLDGEIDRLEKRLAELKRILIRNEHEIERIERQEPHRYQNKTAELQSLLALAQRLEQKVVVEFEANLKKLKSGNLKKRDLNRPQMAYFDAVAVYLGQRVGIIRHINENYTVKSIDLIDRRIFTETGKTIVLTDLGTGQSQSAYLKGLLDTNDRRKVIALIDEVAMMDSHSMEPIFGLLKKKYAEGSLLAAIVVQKGETLSVTPIP